MENVGLGRFIGFCLALLIAVPIIMYVTIPSGEAIFAGKKAYEEAHAGEIVNKKIINASSGLFSSSDTDYRLVIRVEYEYAGKKAEDEKSFSVDKETYQQANIGDWFDSHTLEITAKE